MVHTQDISIPCPYVVGSTFRLRVTPTIGSPIDLYATVLKVYEPDLCLKIPNKLVLKVYDRRFSSDLREQYRLQASTNKTEELYHDYVASGQAPDNLTSINKVTDGFGKLDNCPRELLEHYIAIKTSPYFAAECAAYEQLQSLQGCDVPRLYGSVEFLENPSAPGLGLSIPGILLEPIVGTSLDSMDPAAPNVQDVIKEALRIVDTCGDLGLLNYDVRLGNFIAKPDGSVVMIDFAQSRLRRPDEKELARVERGEMARRRERVYRMGSTPEVWVSMGPILEVPDRIG